MFRTGAVQSLPLDRLSKGKGTEKEGKQEGPKQKEGKEGSEIGKAHPCAHSVLVARSWRKAMVQETFQDIALAVPSFAAAQDRKRGEGGLWGLL